MIKIRNLSVVVLLLISAFLFTAAFSLPARAVEKRVGCCLCCSSGDYCPERYSSLNPEDSPYSQDDDVKIVFSNLDDYEYWIEGIEVYEWDGGASSDSPVYSVSDVAAVPASETSWTWTWHPGDGVDTGRYMVRLKTGCCGYYRTYVDIRAGGEVCCQPGTCCEKSNPCLCLDLNTDRRVYDSGESVFFKLSGFQGMDCSLQSISIHKRQQCGPCVTSSYQEVFYQNLNGAGLEGSSWTFEWDQMDNQGYGVSEGTYEVRLMTDCCGELIKTFEIDDCGSCSGFFFPFLCGGCCCN
ncbi:MAG: hypothetical protein ACLFO3_01705 [Candidatus Acetothermia bacterium]